eukprot:CCRYP_000963-RA/>CCRYP_000963-RA protein AED:0.34 eAED:0.34 QI:1070/1/1/1/0.5/0.33/3/273/266
MFHHDAADKQVDDLRERMRLLQQDRRANIDLLETTKVSNTAEIRSLKEDNKKLRSRLSNLQKSFVLDNNKNQNDVDDMKKFVLQKRNDYDAHKSTTIKLSKSLNKLRDEAKLCRMEEKRPSHEEEPLSRQIRSLENRLDNAMIQYNEAQGICSTYEHIVKRLKEERVSFDNQLTALERTLQSKQRDYEELVSLSADASHSKEMALQNLQKAKWTFDENKNNRARDIRDRQQQIRIRKQMFEKQERFDVERRKASSVSDDTITARCV